MLCAMYRLSANTCYTSYSLKTLSSISVFTLLFSNIYILHNKFNSAQTLHHNTPIPFQPLHNFETENSTLTALLKFVFTVLFLLPNRIPHINEI